MSFFGPGGTGRNIAGLLGDVLLQHGGMKPMYAPALQDRQRMQFEEQQRQRARMEGMEDFQAKKRWEAENAPPVTYEVGNKVVAYDPRAGETKVLYDAPNPAVEYATTLGFQPGTKEYLDAIKDFVLKGNGPTGLANDQELARTRFGYSSALKGAPTYQQANPKAAGGGAAGGAKYEYRMGPRGLQKRRVN